MTYILVMKPNGKKRGEINSDKSTSKSKQIKSKPNQTKPNK